jgi:hypothetical protein
MQKIESGSAFKDIGVKGVTVVENKDSLKEEVKATEQLSPKKRTGVVNEPLKVEKKE